jgi:hypothetical protein
VASPSQKYLDVINQVYSYCVVILPCYDGVQIEGTRIRNATAVALADNVSDLIDHKRFVTSYLDLLKTYSGANAKRNR